MTSEEKPQQLQIGAFVECAGGGGWGGGGGVGCLQEGAESNNPATLSVRTDDGERGGGGFCRLNECSLCKEGVIYNIPRWRIDDIIFGKAASPACWFMKQSFTLWSKRLLFPKSLTLTQQPELKELPAFTPKLPRLLNRA